MPTNVKRSNTTKCSKTENELSFHHINRLNEIKLMFREHFSYLLILTGSILFIFRNLLLSPGFPVGIDVLPWIEQVSTRTIPSLMDPLGGIGFYGVSNFLAIVNLFFHDPFLVVKLFIILTSLLSAFSMYFFTYYLTKEKIAGIFSSIVFITNQWYIGSMLAGHFNYILASAMLPLLLFAFDKSLRDEGLKYDAIFAAILTITLLLREVIVFILPFLLVYAILAVLIPYNGCNRKSMLTKILKLMLTGGGLTFLFSAFQLIPSVFLRPVVSIVTLGKLPLEGFEALSPTLYESLLGVSKQGGPLSSLGGINPGSHPFLSLFQYRTVMSVLPILAFSALFLKKNRMTFFFVISSVISIFLAKGFNPPLNGIFFWLYWNVPFFGLLHSPYKWEMVTYFSYAYLSAVTISTLCIRLQTLLKQITGWAIQLRLEKLSPLTIKIVGNGKFFRKVSRIISVLIVSLIVIPLLFPAWYAIFPGWETTTFPEEYVEPYFWIDEQAGDFRVLSVPYNQFSMSTGISGWRTDVGWIRDLGRISGIFHKKESIHGSPVGVFSRPYDLFSNYIYGTILTKGTNNLMELLGTFDVRYLVMNDYYPTEWSIIPSDYPQSFQHDFFSKQRGLNLVFSNGNSTVYENEFWAPKIFQANKYAIVVGGRETFTDLLRIKNFDLRRYALLWADQIVGELGRDMFFHLLKGSDALIFVNSEPQDLVMLMLKDAIKFGAADFAFPSVRSDSHWILRQSLTEKPFNIWGYFIISGRSAYTTGNVSTSRSMDIITSGEYEVWVRLLVGPDRGTLKISVDDVELGSVIPYGDHYSGFVWRKVGTKHLTSGRHILSLDNDKSIYGNINDVDMIVSVKPETLKSEAESLIKMIEDMPAKEIYILEAQQMFKWIVTKESYNWKTVELPFNGSNGYITSSQVLGFETSAWTQLNYSLLRRGNYGVAFRAGIGPGYGSLNITANGDEVRFMRFSLPGTEPEVMVYDDNLSSSFWKITDPEYVKLSDVIYTDRRENPDKGLKLELLSEGRPHYTIIEKKYWPMVNWRDKSDSFALLFKGSNSGRLFTFMISFNGTRDNTAIYNIVDNSNDWRKLVFSKSHPDKSAGNIDWSKVWLISLATEKDVTGIFYLYPQIVAPTVTGTFEWITSDPLTLELQNQISLSATGRVELDQLVIYSLSKNTTLNDYFKTTEAPLKVSYKMLSFTKFIANIEANKPFFLALSVMYHGDWKAYLNGEEIESIPLYSWVNGFYLEKTGNYEVVLEFIGQRYVIYGWVISTISLVLTLICLPLARWYGRGFIWVALKPWLERLGLWLGCVLRATTWKEERRL